MKKIIKNIGQLVQTEDNPRLKVSGADMKQLNTIEDAFLVIENGLISDFGSMDDWYQVIEDWNTTEIIDADGGSVFPAWCDSHTHIVYDGSREKEFVDRINGLSYEEIAARGGGILNSAKRLHRASEDALFEQASARVREVMGMGTGALEIKSGYGLSLEDELKMLRVIKRLKEAFPITIKSTFLGAHAVPAKYKDNRAAYIDLIVDEMIPQAAAEGLADYVDVFCDRGFFTPEETDRILKAGAAHDMIPKIHANELDFSGGIQTGVANKALSVDHLECTGDEEIEILLNSDTMPTLLPSTAFFLKLHYPPARKMIDAGLAVSLATDYNPGSSPSGKMAFILSLACVQMNMTPEEAINAATINAAYAMGISKEEGSIARGKKANLFITREISSYAFMPYSFGSDLVKAVMINGEFTKNDGIN